MTILTKPHHGNAAWFSPVFLRAAQCVVLILGLTLAFSSFGAEPLTRHFDIPADSAENALGRLIAQSGVDIVFSGESIGGVRTNAVKGDMSPLEAAEAMLAGTRLMVTQDENTHALIVSRRDRSSNAEPPDTRTVRPPVEKSASAARSSDQDLVMMDAMKVTTATRSAKAIDHIPGAVNLITNQDISQNLLVTQDTTAVLEKMIPGYSPSRQGMNTIGESLRGRAPLYLLDSIPQSTPLREGNREAYFADPAIVERIEVVNGPSATEGLGASGGIINFITKTPHKMGTTVTIDTNLTSSFNSHTLGWRADVIAAHKETSYDLLVAAAMVNRPLDYDANGRKIGNDLDAASHDIFIKVGKNFGRNNAQRVQFSLNKFDLTENGNYRELDGNRTLGLTTTATRGAPPGKPLSNTMQDMTFEWSDANLAGGVATVQYYTNSETILFAAQNPASFQDPLIAPIGTLFDQSATVAHKRGVRSSWNRPNLFVTGLELTAGYDYLHDESEQKLLLTNRTFVPLMKFTSNSPFAQLEYEVGPLTLRAGVRHESADLVVDTYTTRYALNRVTVEGGKVSYSQTIPNFGAIFRIGHGWSGYVAYSEGYSVPDVGIVLRNVNTPNQTVAKLAALTPISAKNSEGGVTWRGHRGSFGASVYRSTSKLGATVSLVGGVSQLNRLPVEITGWEITGEYKFTDAFSLTGMFTDINGKTAAVNGGPVDLELSAINQAPTKIVMIGQWAYSSKGNVNLTFTKYLPRNINVGRTGFEEHFGGYYLGAFSTTYQTKWGRIGLGVENVFNKYYIQYVSQSAVNQLTNALYFAGRGRTFTLSNTLTF